MLGVDGVEIRGPVEDRQEEVLTTEALAFLAELERRFNPRRVELLLRRAERQDRLAAGEDPDFMADSREIRESDWTTVPPPEDLLDRRVEITGPVERKMMINALNSGARVFMADFEDANSPTWANNLNGHLNLIDAIEGTISFKNPDGREYRLREQPAYLMVRPRGWHLPEKHVRIDGRPASASLVDFGL